MNCGTTGKMRPHVGCIAFLVLFAMPEARCSTTTLSTVTTVTYTNTNTSTATSPATITAMIALPSTAPIPSPRPPSYSQNIVIRGDTCAMGSANGKWEHQGFTADGRPWYKGDIKMFNGFGFGSGLVWARKRRVGKKENARILCLVLLQFVVTISN